MPDFTGKKHHLMAEWSTDCFVTVVFTIEDFLALPQYASEVSY